MWSKVDEVIDAAQKEDTQLNKAIHMADKDASDAATKEALKELGLTDANVKSIQEELEMAFPDKARFWWW
jgi:hypothetical protein